MEAPALSPVEEEPLAAATPTATTATRAAGERIVVPRSTRISGATLAALAATLGVAAIVLSIIAYVWSLEDDGGAPSAAAIVARDGAEAAAALVARPTTRRIPVRGSVGRIVLAVGAGGQGALVLDGLGAAPPDRAYQAWVIPARGTTARSAAVFDGTRMLVPLAGRVPPGATVAITLERSGGAVEPTRVPRLVARAA